MTRPDWLHCARRQTDTTGGNDGLECTPPVVAGRRRLVAAELATGTFYLLMLALGCAAGALAAHAGVGPRPQVVVAALVGGGATVAVALEARHAAEVGAGRRATATSTSTSARPCRCRLGRPTARARVPTAAPPGRRAWRGRTARPAEHVIVAVHGNLNCCWHRPLA
jgi:hypothetical protein